MSGTEHAHARVALTYADLARELDHGHTLELDAPQSWPVLGICYGMQFLGLATAVLVARTDMMRR